MYLLLFGYNLKEQNWEQKKQLTDKHTFNMLDAIGSIFNTPRRKCIRLKHKIWTILLQFFFAFLHVLLIL